MMYRAARQTAAWSQLLAISSSCRCQAQPAYLISCRTRNAIHQTVLQPCRSRHQRSACACRGLEPSPVAIRVLIGVNFRVMAGCLNVGRLRGEDAGAGRVYADFLLIRRGGTGSLRNVRQLRSVSFSSSLPSTEPPFRLAIRERFDRSQCFPPSYFVDELVSFCRGSAARRERSRGLAPQIRADPRWQEAMGADRSPS